MMLRSVLLLLVVMACVNCMTDDCGPEGSQHGCKIYGSGCMCGLGCRTEFIYRSRRACVAALKERNSNVCNRKPCGSGICIQTAQEPGFSCKCEGTGFFGKHCEKACPIYAVHGLVFPHECIVI